MDAALNQSTTTATSDNWRPSLDEHDPSLKAAADACAQFIGEMEAKQTGRWLTINGEAGCGKTMLARQVYLRAVACNPGNSPLWVDLNQKPGITAKRRPRCVWLDAAEMAERMKGGEYDLPEYLADDFLVVLDDMGAVRDKTDFLADATYRLCQQRREGWTIFTSNLTMAEIAARIDERVASRLIRDRNVQVRITAGDYALKRDKRKTEPVKTEVAVEILREPLKWREWLETAYSGESWADSAKKIGWAGMPHIWRAKICREITQKVGFYEDQY